MVVVEVVPLGSRLVLARCESLTFLPNCEISCGDVHSQPALYHLADCIPIQRGKLGQFDLVVFDPVSIHLSHSDDKQSHLDSRHCYKP
jgi:hypothetical protein